MKKTRTPRTTRWGEEYIAGKRRRAFLPEPEELRRKYGENATAFASIAGSVRSVVCVAMVLMGAVVVAIALVSGSGSPSGWSVTFVGLAIAATAIILTVVIMRKAKQAASLRIRSERDQKTGTTQQSETSGLGRRGPTN
jgi:hypothetical protein